MECGRQEEQGPEHDGDGADDLVVLNHQHRAGADGRHLMGDGHGDGPEYARRVEDADKRNGEEGGEESGSEEKG